MPNENAFASALAASALRLFPPRIRTSALERDEFRQRFALGVDAVVRFNQSGAEFVRSVLFGAIRQVLSDSMPGVDIASKDGLVWRVAQKQPGGLVVSRDRIVMPFPEGLCMSPIVNARLDWFDQQTNRMHVNDRHVEKWRGVLAERPLEDEELDRLLEEFRLTPTYFSGSMSEALRRQSFGVDDLVPSDTRYFDRLAGEPVDDVGAQEFFATRVASHVSRLLGAASPSDGLRAALLLASLSSLAELIDLDGVPRADVLEVFQWLAVQGDRISQVGALECGLRSLHRYPELEPSLAAMTRAIAGDQPADPSGRLRLTSALVALVEGEVGRRNVARRRPPFWRRLTSIAQASLIERGVIQARLDSASMADWALQSGGALFYMQTLIDLRREPRWFPDFISPQQLKAEFVGRIAGSAERHRASIPNGELSSLLWGTESATIQAQMELSALLPGPLEGGIEAVREIPREIEASIRTSLEAEELTPNSFITLVNSSLIFHTGSQLSELAAQALRRVGYQLRKVNANDDPFPLLNSLAMVSAVTRSKELADEVRILARGARRRDGMKLSPEASARIALVAAAANRDVSAWSSFVGEWFTELAFADMTVKQAVALQGDLYTLFHLEPALWETCGRAEAALSAFIESFPDQLAQSNATTE